jgi:hypothetical protein
MITARTLAGGVPSGEPFNVCGIGEGAVIWFNSPVYDSISQTITIETGTTIPLENHEIRVRVGTGIKSSAGQGNGMTGAVEFSYRTPSDFASNIVLWTADYDPDENTITVGYTDVAGAGERREAWYSVNGGAVIRTGIEKGGNSFIIRNVPRLDTDGIRDGRPVGNVYGYQIYIDLYTGGEISNIAGPIKIWNIGTPGGSGMSVSSVNPAIEIFDNGNDNDDSDGTISLKNMALSDTGKNKKYVLVNNITLDGGWTPIGTDTDPLTGKFYGNGHTITIDNITAAADMGLFGVVWDATIRDLTMKYSGSVTRSGGGRFGGIAGTAAGAVRFENVMVQGVFSYTQSSDDTFYVGASRGLWPERQR